MWIYNWIAIFTVRILPSDRILDLEYILYNGYQSGRLLFETSPATVAEKQAIKRRDRKVAGTMINE